MRYVFDSFVIDPAARELRAAGAPVPIEPKVLDLILLLIERRDRMVSKAELVATIWQGRFISDAAISSAISAARRALGDDGREQRYLKTIHGRGFRFVGPLVEVGTGADGADAVRQQDGHGAGARGAACLAAPPLHHGRVWPSVVVLPLRPAGGDPVSTEVACAITGDLAACLSRDRSLAVIAHPDESAADMPDVARRIGAPYPAQYLVEGSVRRVGDAVTIMVRLVDGVDARHVWAERSVQPVHCALTLDDAFASKLAAVIRSEIEATEARRAEAAAGEGLDFRAAYFRGSREMFRFTLEGLVNAQAHFERAIHLNPASATAHARLAYVQIQFYWYGSALAREAALRQAMSGARQAVALDQKDALGHLALGRAWALRQKFDDAIPELEAAIRLDPSSAQARFALGQACCYAGRTVDAVRSLDAAVELNPYDPHLWAFLHDRSEAHFALGSLAAAERDARAAARAPNATHWPWVTLAAVLGAANRREQAQDALRELLSRRPAFSLADARNDLSHFSDAAFVDLYIEGLSRAGLGTAGHPF
ncbi:winged helix-turn-helix domain-containing protein [Cereibacter sphaeroides]|uniref:winged helix-turn-helix domain-containing protein n=1 Tax=Cereibacter sphaeroides TaxID=1063 RepID=UPI001F1D54B0|nr:winged helix-turn-helix domain-containing protein [Cereibacter sphaeroides]MCE6958019.1 winged helix-turn-helix domain-containing protein [Cereibacter sphaeroides]MCE6971954.1 winged helix-turn-helix domain-containing protein [Cereibacter sphaeroides]